MVGDGWWKRERTIKEEFEIKKKRGKENNSGGDLETEMEKVLAVNKNGKGGGGVEKEWIEEEIKEEERGAIDIELEEE